MKKILYSTSLGNCPGHKLSPSEKTRHLYHYTSFNSFVKIWLLQQLRFSPIEQMNDIQEKNVRCASSSYKNVDMMVAYYKMRKTYKQISFTMDYDSYFKGCMSPMMWGYYADKCNGVCIEIDPLKVVFPDDVLKGPVTYKKYLEHYMPIPAYIKPKDDLLKYIRKKKQKIFFTKQSTWSEENEYRVISSNLEYLNISGAIVTVYIASKDSITCQLVERLVDGQVPIKYFTYKAGSNNMSIPFLEDKQVRDEK